MKSGFIIVLLLTIFLQQGMSQESYLLVGTYTGGKSEGIYVYKFNSDDADYKVISHVKTSNPSYLTISPDEKYVFAVQENGKNGNGGQVSAFSFDKEKGTLTLINSQPTKGDHPCYVEIDKTGKWLFAGNYSSGNLSIFPVADDGSLGEPSATISHSGSGPNTQRQAGPHVHCTVISPDNRHLLVADLGIDKIMIYAFDASTGQAVPGAQAFAKSQPGAGPRHIVFHPNGRLVYLIEEISGHVSTYLYEDGRLRFLNRTSTLPRGQAGPASSADIHVSPDGKFLYASNRGDFNNIAMYKLDKKGKANILGFQSSLGKAPRNFNFDPSGNYLLVGNQDSDEIVIFQRNKKTGLLTDTKKRISVGKPVCIKWISIKK
ncbi:MAG TPA: lactonase family protein [Chitinophagaceae bacterium]|nr:lactonase family protein [Chitinophagaceae bacterium]